MPGADVSQQESATSIGRPAGAWKSLMSRRNVFGQLISYGANGLLSAVVYSVVVWTLIAMSRKTFALDVVVAYAASVLWNYLGARFIFSGGIDLRGHVVRYLIVIGANVVFAALVAWVLHRVGTSNLIAAYAPVMAATLPTFLLMRSWVFRASSAQKLPSITVDS